VDEREAELDRREADMYMRELQVKS